MENQKQMYICYLGPIISNTCETRTDKIKTMQIIETTEMAVSKKFYNKDKIW